MNPRLFVADIIEWSPSIVSWTCYPKLSMKRLPDPLVSSARSSDHREPLCTMNCFLHVLNSCMDNNKNKILLKKTMCLAMIQPSQTYPQRRGWLWHNMYVTEDVLLKKLSCLPTVFLSHWMLQHDNQEIMYEIFNLTNAYTISIFLSAHL